MHLPYQYGTTRNFCGVPNYINQNFVVIGAPVDCATTFRSGARMGPNAIRDASMMLTDGEHEQFPVNLQLHVGDAGDMALPSGNTVVMLKEVENSIASFSNKHVVTLGGDHTITAGILRAHKLKHDKIAVVHFDAHCDTWSTHFGEPHGHGTWMYDAITENLIVPQHTISIGIRSPADKNSREFLKNHGGRTVSARTAMTYPIKSFASLIKNQVGDLPTYLSLDIDCLDPAHAPGTGTPEIGGLTTAWMCELLENLQDITWIGMDCVEVNPAYDQGQITALAAATFVWQYLSMIVAKK